MTRRVHSLRLTAPNEQLVRRGALLIEDALRIATLPDTRRLVLIRSLNLGRIDPTRSSVAVALRLEAALAAQRAIYADSSGAGAAPAVYFRDEVEPYVLLIMRLLGGYATPEWFWASAIVHWQRLPKTAPAAVALLIEQVAVQQGTAAAIALLAEIHERHALPALLDVLPLSAGAPLLRAFGWQPAPSAEQVPAEVATALRWPVRSWVERWGAAHPLTQWLVAGVLAAAAPARLAYPDRLLATAAAVSNYWVMTSSVTPGVHTNEPSPLPAPRKTAARETHDPAVAPSIPLPPEALLTQDAAEPAERWWSAGAGLVLTINILERLGIAQLLGQSTVLRDCAFPQRLLQQLADLIDLPPADPIRAVFALPEDALPAPAALAPAFGAESGVDNTQLIPWAMFLREWVWAISRWLAVFTEIDLIPLLARPGYVQATKTHVDVFFRHDQADIRIRRAGIDINPGWTVWLGRVITFYYADDPSKGEAER